jgi:hypothetical protein
MCAEASTVLTAVAADFFFNCWYLEIPSICEPKLYSIPGRGYLVKDPVTVFPVSPQTPK